MPHFRCTKALVASVIALILCSNLDLTRGRAKGSKNQVDNRLTAATSRFSFKLYNQILKQHTDKNTFVSPASVMLALAMTYNGADGTTRDAMSRALEIEGMSLEDVNRAFADLMVIPLFYFFGRMPEGEAPLSEHPNIRPWMRRMEERQSFQVTKPPPI